MICVTSNYILFPLVTEVSDGKSNAFFKFGQLQVEKAIHKWKNILNKRESDCKL